MTLDLPPPPPRHPSTSTFNSPHQSPPRTASSSPPPPPPPKHPILQSQSQDDITTRLSELQEIEIAQMLDRVGSRLVELNNVDVNNSSRESTVYPQRESFRDEGGTLDYQSYIIAYTTTLIASYTPPSLIGHPPREEFSLRSLRDTLSRLYVVCPPSTWQSFLLRDLADLYRWNDPIRTGKYAIGYTFLWFYNLLPLTPIAYLIYLLLHPRLYPPTPLEILSNSTERQLRTREAVELSRQLKNSSAARGVGFAVEGMRGLVGDLRDEVVRRKRKVAAGAGGEKSLKKGLGASTIVGGMVGGVAVKPGEYSKEQEETLRRRRRSNVDGVGENDEEDASVIIDGDDDQSRVNQTEEGEEGEREEDLVAIDESGEVSLYRLMRNLASSFGPAIQTVLEETIDLLEMIRNVIQHPDHPSSLPILLRLVVLFFVILSTPTWLRLKSTFGYLGLEFFVLWKLREMYPQWRRSLCLPWWILLGAPTDAEYALWVLQKRGKEGRPIAGSKTIKRIQQQQRRSRAGSSASTTTSNLDLGATINDRSRAIHRIAKSVSDTASITSTSSSINSLNEKPSSTFFALHRSVPGQIVLTNSTIRFVPTKRLQKLGFHKVVERVAKKFGQEDMTAFTTSNDLTLSSSEEEEGEGDRIGDVDRDRLESKKRSNGQSMTRGVEVQLDVGEVEKVKKSRHYRLPGLEITTKNGDVLTFTNVARRDDAFNKILSSSAVPWERA